MNKKPGEYTYYIAIAVLVAIPNIVLSLQYVGLVHDDSGRFWDINHMVHNAPFGRIFFLNSFREDILFHLALYGSPQLARIFITLIYLVGAACCLFHLATRYFSAPRHVAFIATTMPFLVLSLWQVPLGINISYVSGDVLFTLIVIRLVLGFLARRVVTPLDPVALIFAFVLTAETQTSAIVTAPIIALVALTWGPTTILRRSISMALMLASIVYIFLQEGTGSSRKTFNEPVQFLHKLLEYWSDSTSIISPAFNIPGWSIFGALVVLVGVTGLWVKAFQSLFPGKDRINAVLAGNPILSAFVVVIGGMVWSLVPYAAVTPAHREPMERYYFIWQFFFWLAFAIGLSILISRLITYLIRISSADSKKWSTETITGAILSLFVVTASWGKATIFAPNWPGSRIILRLSGILFERQFGWINGQRISS